MPLNKTKFTICYLQVAAIFGITGARRRQELCDLTVNDVEDRGNMLLVTIPKTKTGIERKFTVIDELYQIYKKYAALRPKNAKTNRFFLSIRNGKCTQQVIGINKIGNMPKDVAMYLKLPNVELYTGHSFRRTSTTILADSGADILTLKRHGGWASDKVAEGYIEESVGNKRRICERITASVMSKKSSSNETPATEQSTRTYVVNPSSAVKSAASVTKEEDKKSTKILTPNKDFTLQLNHCSNVTIQYSHKGTE